MSRKKRVLYVCDARSIGGGEIYLSSLAVAMANSYDQFIFCRKSLRQYFQTSGLKTLPYWANLPALNHRWIRRIASRLQTLMLRMLFNLYPPDLVSVQSFGEDITKLQGLCAQKSIPIILTAHTLFDPAFRPHYEGNIPVFNRFKAILCVCNATKNNLRRLGIDRPKLMVQYNGVDTETFTPLPSRRTWVIWVGRIDNIDKNAGCFFEIAALASQQNLHYNFKMVGDGPLLSELKSKSEALGLRNLQFTGFLEHSPTIYTDAAALCLTSTSEAMPLSVLEAMSCGVPVVSTKVGGVPEIINSSASGILVDRPDAELFLKALREHVFVEERSWRQLSAAARERIEASFRAADQYAKTKTTYEETMQ